MGITERRKRERASRRRTFFEVARSVFLEKGYAGTTIEEIARRSEFSKRTVYLYFENKDDLFVSVVEEGVKLLRGKLEAIDVVHHSVEESFVEILKTYMQFAQEYTAYFRFIFSDMSADLMARVSPPLRQRMLEHERACLAIPAAVAAKAIDLGYMEPIDPVEIATIFWGACTGIIVLALGGSQGIINEDNMERYIQRALTLLWNSLINKANLKISLTEEFS